MHKIRESQLYRAAFCVTRRVALLLRPNEVRASVAAVDSAVDAVPGRPAFAYRTHAALAAGVRASAVEPTAMHGGCNLYL
jgi:hypothetical protein